MAHLYEQLNGLAPGGESIIEGLHGGHIVGSLGQRGRAQVHGSNLLRQRQLNVALCAAGGIHQGLAQLCSRLHKHKPCR